ncbi:MAG: hypothetical protein HYR96_01200 [Deltaproteobacteria bacterium]|nr:hypothetical protein [Deltaproteobacteria bacterium]MBI3296486.1 hypothetical protein [Deltaproteobacteria bacterium]
MKSLFAVCFGLAASVFGAQADSSVFIRGCSYWTYVPQANSYTCSFLDQPTYVASEQDVEALENTVQTQKQAIAALEARVKKLESGE